MIRLIKISNHGIAISQLASGDLLLVNAAPPAWGSTKLLKVVNGIWRHDCFPQRRVPFGGLFVV